MEKLLAALGFRETREDRRFDAFAETSVERITNKYRVYGANVFARR